MYNNEEGTLQAGTEEWKQRIVEGEVHNFIKANTDLYETEEDVLVEMYTLPNDNKIAIIKNTKDKLAPVALGIVMIWGEEVYVAGYKNPN